MTDFNGILGKYYYYFFSTNFYERAMRMTAKGTVDSVRLDMISKMDIKMPKKISEQKKIADCLTKLDNLITLHQRKIQLYNRFMTIVWEQRKLGELASIYDGVHKTPNYKDSGIMFLSVENIITLKSKKYISEEDFERDYKVHPERGDIFMTRIGDVGTTNVVESSEKLAFYVSLALLKPIDSYPYFLNNAMKTNDFQMKLRKRTLVTAIPQKINKDEIGKLELFITYNFVEQKKIGDYFRKLDQLITLHQWKWYFFDKKVGNAWEQRKLGELGSVSMCRRIFKEQTSERGDIPFYKIGTFGAVADAFISKELFEEYKLKYPYPKKGDILISASGSIGRTVEFTGKNEYFQDSNIVWLNHDERLSNTFLKCFYSVVKWTGIEGSTIKRLYNDNILNTVINLPSIHEQNKIGAYFAKIDNLITLHQWKWFVYGKIRGIVWIQRKSIKILVIQRKYTLLRVVIVFEWFIICCVCFENIQLRFIAVIEFKIFCIIVDEYVVLIVIECIYVIVVFEVYYALLEFVLIIKSCYVFDDGLFL